MVHAEARPGTGKYRCHYCGSSRARTTDHIVPRSRGGRDDIVNYVKACAICNQDKGNALPVCRCPKCVEAIRSHWEYIDGFHPSIARGLAAQVQGMPRLESTTAPSEDEAEGGAAGISACCSAQHSAATQ